MPLKYINFASSNSKSDSKYQQNDIQEQTLRGMYCTSLQKAEFWFCKIKLK